MCHVEDLFEEECFWRNTHVKLKLLAGKRSADGTELICCVSKSLQSDRRLLRDTLNFFLVEPRAKAGGYRYVAPLGLVVMDLKHGISHIAFRSALQGRKIIAPGNAGGRM